MNHSPVGPRAELIEPTDTRTYDRQLSRAGYVGLWGVLARDPWKAAYRWLYAGYALMVLLHVAVGKSGYLIFMQDTFSVRTIQDAAPIFLLLLVAGAPVCIVWNVFMVRQFLRRRAIDEAPSGAEIGWRLKLVPHGFGYYLNGSLWILFLPVSFLLYMMGLYLLFDPFLIVP